MYRSIAGDRAEWDELWDGEPEALVLEGLECLFPVCGDEDLSLEASVADEWAEEDEVRIGEPEAFFSKGPECLLFFCGD